MTDVQLGNYHLSAAQDAELALVLPTSFAPWEAANRVAQFLHAWLDIKLQQNGASADDVNYVVNELMENAVKYAAEGSIELSIGFEQETLRISLTHPVPTQSALRYQTLSRELVARDPDELFMEIIERNASAEAATQQGAGLGLVTLRQNYHAQLGFAFHALDPTLAQVTTQVCLPCTNPPNTAQQQQERSL
jgi:hypothetical protein